MNVPPPLDPRRDGPSTAEAARAFAARAHQRALDRHAQRAALQAALKDGVRDLAPHFGLTRVVLFGSLADDSFHPERSDIDLLVDAAPDADLFGFAGALTGRLRVPVHVIARARAPQSLTARATEMGAVLLEP